MSVNHPSKLGFILLYYLSLFIYSLNISLSLTKAEKFIMILKRWKIQIILTIAMFIFGVYIPPYNHHFLSLWKYLFQSLFNLGLKQI